MKKTFTSIALLGITLALMNPHAEALPTASQGGNPDIQVAFSPDEGAERLIVDVIDSAHKTVKLAAYSFTSPNVVKALVAAKKRGADVQVIVDYKNNVGMKSRAAIAALNLLANNHIPIKLISAYAIHHDKYIIVDDKTVETGSFNYSKAAQTSNSENIIVLWNRPDIAQQYNAHWLSRFKDGSEYKSSY